MKQFNHSRKGGKHTSITFLVKKGKNYRIAAALTTTCAICFSTSISATSSEHAVSARYADLQSFIHQFGSKLASGYFVREIDRCLVTLRIAEKGNTESQAAHIATQVRLVLNPGQTAGLDSEEGQSLNLTCNTNATALILDSGGKDALMAAQKRAISDNDFSEFVIP